MPTNYLSVIRNLLITLSRKRIINTIYNLTHVFYDEPKVYHYGASLNFIKKYSDGIKPKSDTTAGGLSFDSKNLALLKCLVEIAERFALYTYKESNLIYENYSDLVRFKKNPIDISSYHIPDNFRQIKIAWVQGFDLIKKTRCIIPAQLVYLNYKGNKNEKFISPIISTGAAGGFSHKSTLIRGIYELFERDAFMTLYLLKIKPNLINPDSLNDQKIKDILNAYKRYNLDVYLLDITNDLAVPTILSIVMDKTGLGPYVTVGLKSSFDINKATIGSLTEAYATRTWLREEIMANAMKHNIVKPILIKTFLQRAAFWYDKAKIKHLSFLIQQKPTLIKINPVKIDEFSEFELLKEILKKNDYHLYYVDLTPNFLKKMKLVIYKVISPELQPLYLIEDKRDIRRKRLNLVAKYFNLPHFSINKIPHPFL